MEAEDRHNSRTKPMYSMYNTDQSICLTDLGPSSSTNDYYQDGMQSGTDRPSNYWLHDLASDYEYCLVFPAENGNFTEKGRGYIQTFRKLGFELFIYKNLNALQEIYVLLRTPLEKLRAFADNLDFLMLLDAKEVEDCITNGDSEEGISSRDISHMPEVTRYRPFEKIYGRYSRQVPETLYYHEYGATDPFRELVRLKLTSMIMESKPSDGSQNLKIRRYIRTKSLLGCFPLHNRNKTRTIEVKWELYPRQRLPIHDLKEYFGEKLGLYFAFMEHYTSFLWIPAVSALENIHETNLQQLCCQ
jgi:hypothetical protein